MKFTYAYLKTCARAAQIDPNYTTFKNELLLDLSTTDHVDFNVTAEHDVPEVSSDVCKVTIQDLIDNPSFCKDDPCSKELLAVCKFLKVDHAFISVGRDASGIFAYSALIFPIDEFAALPANWKKTIGPLFDPATLKEIEEDMKATAGYHKTTRSAMPVFERLIGLCLNGPSIPGFTGWMDE